MTLTKQPYKGTRDFFPSEKRTQNYIFQQMRESAELFGYEPYDGPLLEEVDLYRAKSGEELINEQIYSFYDRGKRFVAIRPEMTPTLARMVSQVHRQTSKPIRWYSIPNLMRYENPQKGRLREHWQLNCDIFGAPANLGELEILEVAVQLLRKLGADERHFDIQINDRRIVDVVMKKLLSLNADQSYRLYKIIDQYKKLSTAEIDKKLQGLALSAEKENILKEYLTLKSFQDVENFLQKNEVKEDIADFLDFFYRLKETTVFSFCHYDPTVVRGLDYYTGLVFEIFDKHPDNRRAICGGGAYAHLLQIFGEESVPAVGFGLGDVTLKDFLITHKLLPDFTVPKLKLLVTIQHEGQETEMTAWKLCAHLRQQGIQVQFHPATLKMNKVFPLAEKKGAQWVALIGEREISQQKVEIKNMTTKQQFHFDLKDISSIVNTLIGEND